ncbi:E3 ubiquitin-protein ligase UHRF1 isoform X2 [Ooceraea biroi]|uniref:E3 ubiquitin-protein ligase UHRF1 isoform X2 n=1 Tax=Ooceraea biroi TaxID=2015173 RepID=UPI000F07BCE5|nr:E3 ubiquitin-protein ligase UHRF1 isoform X2 [Ooceraea biroi]
MSNDVYLIKSVKAGLAKCPASWVPTHEIQKELQVDTDLQRLFFRGKQLENGYKLYDYNINLNEVIQLIVKVKADNAEEKATSSDNVKKKELSETEEEEDELVEKELLEAESLYYKVGDAVDCYDQTHGAWFEAIVQNIFKKEEQILYNVRCEFDDKLPYNVPEKSIRPRARRVLSFDELSVGQKVMINYNVDDPKNVGLWYDFTISKIDRKRRWHELSGMLRMSDDHQLKIEKFSPKKDIFAIETPKLLAERTAEDEGFMISNGKRRPIIATCSSCMDDENEKCRECGCKICAGKHDEHYLLLCDECNYAFHLSCLDPPLTAIPDEDYWYCPECKNDDSEIVKAGERLKQSKKKSSVREVKDLRKDWGKGMACVGRTKICSIVPSHHRGPIPGIEVGMCWMFRMQVSEMGVHRPHVAGIHGRETDCAYSIVLSGGYEDDTDNGDEFLYTGSGGRDLSGNRRVAKQSSDQMLTRMNKALARNCNAKLNAETGAIATHWKEGIPVRVVRNSKLKKYSKYAPQEGNRYDGTYKVVKYYPDVGKSGFRVWKYLLRRDDPSPAPWSKQGKARIASLGLKLIYPDGYLEAMKKVDTGVKKRSIPADNNAVYKSPPTKKRKQRAYDLEDELNNVIKNDKLNTKLWAECSEALPMGKAAFLERVSERFMCACCLEIVYNPVTIPCGHSICLKCLKRSFVSDVHFCPSCRYDLGKSYNMEVNQSLASALLLIYPGYENGR